MRIFLGITALISILFLSGCVDVEESIWINSDGSGRIKIDISVASEEVPTFGSGSAEEAIKSYREDMTRDMETKKENVKKIEYVAAAEITKIYAERKGELDHFVYDIKTQDVGNLNDIYQEVRRDQVDEKLNWYIAVEKKGKNRVLFTQVFESTPEEEDLKEAEETSPDEADKRFYKVKLHAPKIVSTNGELDKTYRAVEWTIPFSELAGDKHYRKELMAEIYLSPLKHYLIVTGLGAGVILLITAGIYVRRRRKT